MSDPTPDLTPAPNTIAEPEAQLSEQVPIIPPNLTPKKMMIGIVALLLCLTIYLLRLDSVVGLFVDDGWYVLLAQALATGQGYALINSPTPGILPLYPPGFPALLAVFYRLYPSFPENVWLLKAVSIAAMLGTGYLAYYYFHLVRQCPRHFAFLLGLTTTLCVPLVYLATGTVMSECVFTFSFLLAITLIEKGALPKASWKYLLGGAVVVSFAFLTRSTGIALVLAIGVYLLKERLYRALILVAIVVAVLTGPWVIYSRLHAPTPAQRNEQRGMIVEPYTTQFWQRQAGNASSGTITISDLPSRVWENFLGLAGRDLGRILIAPIADDLTRETLKRRIESGSGQSFELDAGSWLSLLLLAFVAVGLALTLRERMTLAEIAVVFSLLLTFLWPFEVLRFVLPLAPFLLYYLGRGWGLVHSLYQRLNMAVNLRGQWISMSVIVSFVLLVNLWGNVRYIKVNADTVKDPTLWTERFTENVALMNWVKTSTPAESVIATQNPPLVYLYTNRKTISSDEPAQRWELWNQLKVKYLVLTSVTPLGDLTVEESVYGLAFRTRGALNLRVLDLGDFQGRAPWGTAPPKPVIVVDAQGVFPGSK